ncbi:hypothetical protein TB1_026799 [Malus domestica]
MSKADKLKVALDVLFPCSSSVNLQHLKPLYVTDHIEGYPIFKIFIDCGATVNIMPESVMKALRRSNNKLIPLGITMSSFVGDKSQTKEVFPLEKATEVGAETVHQDSTRLGLANLIAYTDV